jgi:hypothetical protein
MGVVSQQGISYQLVANGIILDLFQDEVIQLSDNVTGLFDLGIVPADFTRQFNLPGTKKNNDFFQHVYDISVYSPDTFATNKKVSCYLDFGGIYLAQGYLQLNKVNVVANKFIDSYEVSLYGSVSSFAREVNRSYLTDMTSSLASYNHTFNLTNISASWDGNLKSGDIIYPLAEYGQKILYSPETEVVGIDTPQGALFVQDFKPSIRVKKVWDAIFQEYGYTYSSSFWQQPFLDDVYMVCNNQLKYPIFDEENLETYGLLKMQPISGSTEIPLYQNTPLSLPYFNITSNPANNIDTGSLVYTLDYASTLRGIVNLNVKLVNPGPPVGSNFGYPKFSLVITNASGTPVNTTPLTAINDYFENLSTAWISQGTFTPTQKFTVPSEFNTGYLTAGTYKFAIKYEYEMDDNFYVVLDPDGELKSYLEITKAGNVGEGWTINIGKNMPFGTNGIKKIDFITGIQKKFNLVMYPSKTKQREFIVETFNNWYNDGRRWDFDPYINLDKNIEVIPANNLAVNELNFGDKLDQDYVSQQFSKEANREYGKAYYVDTQNFFSQGKFEVQSTFASSPIIYLSGTGISGSKADFSTFRIKATDAPYDTQNITCLGSPYTNTRYQTIVYYTDTDGNVTTNNGPAVTVTVRYETELCDGSFGTQAVPITISNGDSGSVYIYNQSAYVDCGIGAPCLEELQNIQCIASSSGQYGIAVWSGSVIPAC